MNEMSVLISYLELKQIPTCKFVEHNYIQVSGSGLLWSFTLAETGQGNSLKAEISKLGPHGLREPVYWTKVIMLAFPTTRECVEQKGCVSFTCLGKTEVKVISMTPKE